MHTVTVDFIVDHENAARVGSIVDDVLSGVNDRLEHHAEANAEQDDPDPDVTWHTHDAVSVDRHRLGRIGHVVDRSALLDAMREMLPDVDDSARTFSALSDVQHVALLHRFDRPGVAVHRVAATSYSAERAEVGVILPSGGTCSFDCTGPDASRWTTTPEVNWSALGASSTDDAMAFAAALSFAAGVAAGLSGPVK